MLGRRRYRGVTKPLETMEERGSEEGIGIFAECLEAYIDGMSQGESVSSSSCVYFVSRL